jgi:protein-S-isoprenylcysteine O-methyltransferase Ste14
MSANPYLYRALLVSGGFFFRFRNALFPLVLVVIVLAARPARFSGYAPVDQLVTAAGVAAVLAGEIFRLAVIGYAYIQRGGRRGRVHANALVTRGFYAHTRNPMYVGNFLIVVGLALVFGSPGVLAAVAASFAWIYLAIVTAEEAFLREKFGADYDDYARRVNRFVPDFRGLRHSLGEFRYDWRRALVKEYNTLTFTLAAMLGLLAWRTVYLSGYADHSAQVSILCGALLPLAVFYGVVRYLKKTRRLQPARWAESEEEVGAA